MSEVKESPSIGRLVKAGTKMMKRSGVGAYDDPEAYDWIVEKVLVRNKLAKDLVDCIQRHTFLKSDRSQKVLDEAAGTGAIAIELAKRGYRVSATDMSSEMLIRLKSKADANGISIDIAKADLNKSLPYPNNTFAVVTTASANRYITNLAVFLDEAHRVLQNDGLLVWTVLAADIIPWKLHAGISQSTTSKSLLKEMEKHGFKHVSIEKTSLVEFAKKGILPHVAPVYLIGQK